ncbi:MAG: hypothetical protein GXP36_10795 [Actinobacteria bacterium]|nr:hypothetical protein [Actinomycetota bacterium]
MAHTAITALVGGEVSIATTAEISSTSSAIATYQVPGYLVAFEFTASYAEYGRAVAADLGIQLTDAFTFQSGQILIGSGVQLWAESDETGKPFTSKLSIATWEGENYSLHTHAYELDPLRLVGVLDAFRIEEHATGLTMTPQDPKATLPAIDPTVLQELTGVALLQIHPRTAARENDLPARAGTRVRGGDLYVDRSEDADSYILVGATTDTRILVDDGCHDDTLLDALGSLEVSWGS